MPSSRLLFSSLEEGRTEGGVELPAVVTLISSKMLRMLDMGDAEFEGSFMALLMPLIIGPGDDTESILGSYDSGR